MNPAQPTNTPPKEDHPRHPDFTLDKLKEGKNVKHSMIHLNGNLMCAVDTETSGFVPGKHDLIQLAVIPLTPDYKPSKIYKPFCTLIQPKRPENCDPDLPPKMRAKFIEACTHGIDAWTCVDRFSEWFYSLKLPEKKKIVPLGHNFGAFDMPFIKEWLGGPLSYEEFFRSDFRDTMLATLFINDCFESRNERIPFPKSNLSYLAHVLGIEHPEAHDATADAFVTSQVYAKLMRWQTNLST